MKSKLKQRHPKWFYCELFKRNIYSFHEWDLADVILYCRKQFNTHLPHTDGKGGYTWELLDDEKAHLIIWTKKGKYSISYLAHEITHVKNALFRKAGVKLCTDNDEVESYYVEMLIRNLL